MVLHCPCGGIIVHKGEITEDHGFIQCGFCKRWLRPAQRRARELPPASAEPTLLTFRPNIRLLPPAQPGVEKSTERLSHPWSNRESTISTPDSAGADQCGMRWGCAHSTTEQIGAKRCIRCCATKDLSYVLRCAAGGSPAGWRWLCPPCLEVYRGLDLVDAPRRTHVEAMQRVLEAGA